LCSSTDRIQVHHIDPYRYSKSHALSNLMTLCRRCHSKEELKINQRSRAGLLLRWSQKKDLE
jgi:5-methylcytosine-specific restriction endonuclease McrA